MGRGRPACTFLSTRAETLCIFPAAPQQLNEIWRSRCTEDKRSCGKISQVVAEIGKCFRNWQMFHQFPLLVLYKTFRAHFLSARQGEILYESRFFPWYNGCAGFR